MTARLPLFYRQWLGRAHSIKSTNCLEWLYRKGRLLNLQCPPLKSENLSQVIHRQQFISFLAGDVKAKEYSVCVLYAKTTHDNMTNKSVYKTEGLNAFLTIITEHQLKVEIDRYQFFGQCQHILFVLYRPCSPAFTNSLLHLPTMP